jgi:phospholipid-translocating ATPase
VGDFVLIRSNEPIPADVVILSTSEPDGNCYVETKNLDGETNLKIRNGVHHLSHIRTPEDCRNLRFLLDVEEPNSLMYAFNAKLTINPTNVSDPPPEVLEAPANRRRSVITEKNLSTTESDVIVPININGVLLRGCILRNTAWVIGIVVYTGNDTRLMQNSGKTPSKRSRIDKMLNPQIFLNFGFLFVMCFICGILGAVYQGAFQNAKTLFANTDQLYSSPYAVGVIIFFLSLIIFQQIVPIALYLSIEVAKTCQSLLIHVDLDLYDEKLNTSLSPRSWNLCDDLGNVDSIDS